MSNTRECFSDSSEIVKSENKNFDYFSDSWSLNVNMVMKARMIMSDKFDTDTPESIHKIRFKMMQTCRVKIAPQSWNHY